MSYPKHPGVYAIVHIESGRAYVGSSVNIYSRWRQHKAELANNHHHCKYLQNAWNKYGGEAFEWRVLETTLRESVILEAREDHWMGKFKGSLFNSSKTARACLGRKVPDDVKRKMREKMLGNKNSTGSHNGKLNDRSAMEVMYRYAAGERSDKLADDYGVSRNTITRVANRKVWWHVTVPPEIEAKCREMTATHGTAEPLVMPIPEEPKREPKPVKPKRRQKRRYESKPRPSRVPVSCSNCDAAMLICPHRFRDHKSHYCSKDCRRQGFSKRVTQEMTEPERRKRLAEANMGKHASEETKAKMSASQTERLERAGKGRIIVACATCKSEMSKTPSQVAKGRNFYCSRGCLSSGMSAIKKEEMKDPARREHLSKINTGKKLSEETKRKIAESLERKQANP